MFPNSPEREQLKHSLGRVPHHSVVSRGSPVLFGSDTILLLAGFMLSSIHRRLLSPLPRTGTVPKAWSRSPRSGCSLQTAAQLPGSVFPTPGTNSLTTDSTNPIKRALPPAGVTSRCPGQVGHRGRIHQQHSDPGTAGWKRDHYML